MIKTLREFSEKNKTLYFFMLIVFLIVFLFINANVDKNKKLECKTPLYLVDDTLSNEYEIKIKKADETIILFVKRYDKKLFIEKTEKGISYYYYIYYSDMYKKDENGIYQLYTGNVVDGIDNKLLYVEYIDYISTLSKEDEADEKTCYFDNKYAIDICFDASVLEVDTEGVKLTYEFSKVGEIEDFDIDVNNQNVVE